jgi:hypothetical protein
MKFLVQFSGGWDSLGALLKVLEKEPTGIYDLYHLQIRGTSGRWIAQLQAVLNLRIELSRIFKQATFNLKLPIIDVDATAIDAVYYQCICGVIGSVSEYNYIVNGTTRTDCRMLQTAWPEKSELQDSSYIGDKLLIAFPNVAKVWRPLVNFEKSEILLPSSLQQYVWSCEFPQISGDICKPCKHCDSCFEYEMLKMPYHSEIHLNMTYALYQHYLTQKSLTELLIT